MSEAYLTLCIIPLVFLLLFATFCTCVCHFIFLSIIGPKKSLNDLLLLSNLLMVDMSVVPSA